MAGGRGVPIVTAATSRYSLRNRFDALFEVRDAAPGGLLEDTFRLRYQAFCIDNAFEDPRQHPDGLERDVYDARARHAALVSRADNQVIGSVRLILPAADAGGASLPIERVCQDPLIRDRSRFPAHCSGEVSRLVLSKRAIQGPRQAGGAAILARIGLLKAIVRLSAACGVTRLLAIMEPSLIRLVGGFGVVFEPAGPPLEFHGLRQPCYGDIRTMLARVGATHPDVFDVLTENGRLFPEVARGKDRFGAARGAQEAAEQDQRAATAAE